ncbi:sigma-70 family RNA polymerase sigma factor [Nocardioides sp. Kera G14]|uniref:sigma-70 family RNA polymerase sigma factor n=1 Tax=Nocardioides sp. Kera G14 TaxID=2884264 RepID=UPI001D105FFB|nr:sigma-70 family RNA polymerase sigma factor [Nocardioides sp. Kera G14]UDY24678.1 sigma-70 family RNA polymerase sigma factor [Nocardioides sp. Kera G14]
MSEVSDALPQLDEPGDAELISAVRGGDTQAYGMLFERHVEAARRLSRQLVSAGDVDDLVSEAFSKVLTVLQKGGGPDLAFRAYLLTSIRRLHVDRLRSGARLQTTDDLTPYDPGVPFEDTAVAGFENATAAKAFASLPERWQQVLWHTEVEGQKPADIAPLLGMSANSVSALAYRAREGLREAFVSMHAQEAVEDACAKTRAGLGAYLRGGSSKRDAAKVESHLKDCRECSAIHLELAEVNSNLGAVLAPMLLGSAGVGYLAAAHTAALAAAKGGVLLFLDRAKDWVLHNPAGRATGGAAAAVVTCVAVAAGVQAAGHHAPPVATPRKPVSVSTATPSNVPAPPAPAPATTTPAAPTTPPVAMAATASPAPAVVPATVAAQPSASESDSDEAEPPVISTPLPAVTLAPEAGSTVIDLTNGATHPDGDPLTVKSARIVGAAHGAVDLGGVAARPMVGVRRSSGPTTITYTPDPAWRGTETIAYVLSDGHHGTVSGTVSVTTPDRAPVATDDRLELHAAYSVTTPHVIDVLGNDRDANHDTLTVASVGSARLGSVELVDGEIRYTLPVWKRGQVADQTDTFSYTVNDGFGGTSTGTVSVVIGFTPNAAPVPTSTSLDVDYEHAKTVRLDDLAVDPDGDELSATIATQAHHGTATLAGGMVTYTPEEHFSGEDSFTLSVDDGVASTTVVVPVTVAPNPVHLGLTDDHPAEPTGDVGNHFAVSGLPTGGSAKLEISVTGFAGYNGHASGSGQWDVAGGAHCTTPPADGSSSFTVVCTVSDNGEVLHWDFDVDSTWSLQATLTATDFDADAVEITKGSN